MPSYTSSMKMGGPSYIIWHQQKYFTVVLHTHVYFKKYKETIEYPSTPNNVDQFYKCIPETIVFKPILTSATFFKYGPESVSLNQF